MSEYKNNSRAERELRHEKEYKERKIVNKIWLWLGIIVLIAILLYWLFAIGTFEGPNQ